jgi:serine/threonine protein kinase
MPQVAPAKTAPPSLDFLAPPQKPGELGRLGPYRILKVLGQGGMGLVFLADDAQLKRTIALKVMLPKMAARAEARERFLREARSAAALEHDHVIPIFQVGEDRGVPFIAMPFLKGATLEEYIKRKPLTVPQIMRIGREIAKGLAAAHEKGLVHRDIKPANLWLDATAKGRVKILDFGLARLVEEDIQLTQEGAILGTPAYMSPEQAAGKPASARSDLFSLGAVLYRLCTGQRPFHGKNTLAILHALATENPKPIAELNPDVPPAFAELIMQMLEKDPARRTRSAYEIAEAIYALERERILRKLTLPNPALQSAGVSQVPTLDPDQSNDSYLNESDLHFEPPALQSTPPRRAGTFWVAAMSAGILLVLAIAGGVLWNRPADPAVADTKKDQDAKSKSHEEKQKAKEKHNEGKDIAKTDPAKSTGEG